MRLRHHAFNRHRLLEHMKHLGRAVKRVGHAMIIISHVVGVPATAIEIWFYLDPPTSPTHGAPWLPPVPDYHQGSDDPVSHA